MREQRVSMSDGTMNLTTFLRSHRDDILREWEEGARKLASATELDRPELIDFVPPLLERIACIIEQEDTDAADQSNVEAAEKHAADRLAEGFHLTEVIRELMHLRDCVLRLWERDTEPPDDAREQERRLLRAFDTNLAAAADRYTRDRDRILRALDRVSSTALEARDLEQLLQNLIGAFLREMPSVDTVAILLCEGDVIRLRAASGLEEVVPIGFAMNIGEGFAGKIAAEKQPCALRDASSHPIVKTEVIRSSGVRALYGVPLLDDGEVIGVAHMGSVSAPEFSQQDRVLFATMASRASAGIVQQTLHQTVQEYAREIEESHRRFEATFESAAVGIALVALDGSWLRLNKRYCDILGFAHDELLGVRFQDLTHPDDLAQDVRQAERLITGEADGYTAEKRYVRKDGSTVWVNRHAALVRDTAGEPEYFVAAVEDITHQRLLRDRLEFLARASEVIGSSLDLQETLNKLCEISVPAIADWCGVELVPRDDMLDPFLAIAHRDPSRVERVRALRREAPPDREVELGPARVMRTGEPQLIAEIDDELLRRSGIAGAQLQLIRDLDIGSLLCVPMTGRGRVIGAMTLAQAESGRTFSDDDLSLAQEIARRASLAIENARLHEEVSDALRLRDQILAIVSHDLRNPIGAISLASHLLVREERVRESDNARRQLEVIQRGTARASRLISDLRDMTSIRSGQLSLELEPCELAPLLVEVVESHEPLAKEQEIGLHWQLHLGNTRVFCDRDRVSQVLGNLIGNALKVCAAGDEIGLRAEVEGKEAIIAVSDTGPGIVPEQLEHIFELYWKGQKRGEGTGLGLFISRGIVESHGGRLWVESRLGEGTTFSFSLPVADEPSSRGQGSPG